MQHILGHLQKTNLLNIGITRARNEQQTEKNEWNISLKAAANETLSIKDGVARVHGGLVFGGITDETLLSREGDVGRRSTVSLYDT